MLTLAEQKKQLRKQVRALKSAFTSEQLEQKSLSALKIIAEHPAFVKAKVVMLYHPLPDEVDMRPLIKQFINEKKIILPTIVGDDIVPVPLTHLEELKTGAFNILEPDSKPYEGSFDLIVVPGMAFDAQGHRLGRGKGFYDRFLAKYPGVPTIGVCFDFQCQDQIPTESFDQPVTYLVATL